MKILLKPSFFPYSTKRGDLEWGAHAGATGVANTVDVGGGEGGGGESGADEGERVLEVVLGGLAREEAMAGRGDVGVARVRQNGPVQCDDAHPDFVRRALYAQGH